MRFQGSIIEFYGTPKSDALKVLVEELKTERTSESSHKTAPLNTWGEMSNGNTFFVMPPCQTRLKKRGKWSRWSIFYKTLIQHSSNGDDISSVSTSDKKRLRIISTASKLTETDMVIFGLLLNGVPISFTWDPDEFECQVQGKEVLEIKVK